MGETTKLPISGLIEPSFDGLLDEYIKGNFDETKTRSQAVGKLVMDGLTAWQKKKERGSA